MMHFFPMKIPLWLCLVLKKFEEKINRRKKKKFKVNKLFLYISSNSYTLFFYSIKNLNNLKLYKILTNLNYILFSLIFFILKLDIRKLIFISIFFFIS